MMITKGLEDRTKYYKLDVDREWTPARAMTTEKVIGPGTNYARSKASDYMPQKVTIFLDNVEKGKAGKRAIMN